MKTPLLDPVSMPHKLTEPHAEIAVTPPPLHLRHPDEVMTLARLGSFFPNRLSFMRSFIRQVASQRAEMSMPVCALDKNGYGHIVLSLPVSGRLYSLIAYSRALDDSERTDRVIATKWDASFCLYDGMPEDKHIAWLADQVIHQEAGRYHHKVLTLSRANRSVRLFAHVVEQLSKGLQPSAEQLVATGYLMRTTAVYGNGKFGIADRDIIADYPGLEGPFQAEMLTVFLIREFTFFWAEYCAKQIGGSQAAILAPDLRRYLGIGNSTGLGMAPFLVTHPCLVHSWILARETAFLRIRAKQNPPSEHIEKFRQLLNRAKLHSGEWQVEDQLQMARIITLRHELADYITELNRWPLAHHHPFADAFDRVKECSSETQELIISLLMELSPEDIDGLADCMSNPHEPQLYPAMQLAELKALLDEHYQWCDDIDLTKKEADSQFWYVSEEKLEPRLGRRYEEPGAEFEMPFNIPLYVHHLKIALSAADDRVLVGEFLITHPELRHIIRRVQTIGRYPYGEIRDNLVGENCRPIDLLRCKLSFFGASKFDPKSDRWTRITLYQGAPTAADLRDGELEKLDDWLFALAPQKSADRSQR